MAQGADSRAALGRRDEYPLRAGGNFPEPRQQAIVGGKLIDAAATRRTVGEVGGDGSQLRLGELALGQSTQRFVTCFKNSIKLSHHLS